LQILIREGQRVRISQPLPNCSRTERGPSWLCTDDRIRSGHAEEGNIDT